MRQAPRLRAGTDVWPGSDIKFRRSVEDAAKENPNFAGSFVVEEISCGTGCRYIAVLDGNSGAVFTRMPFSSLIVDVNFEEESESKYKALEYRVSSRLLIADGWFDTTSETNRGYLARNYYEWTGHHFRLLKSVRLPGTRRRHLISTSGIPATKSHPRTPAARV